MEKMSISDLPDGTKDALLKLAKNAGFVSVSTGKPNIAAFMRKKIERMIK